MNIRCVFDLVFSENDSQKLFHFVFVERSFIKKVKNTCLASSFSYSMLDVMVALDATVEQHRKGQQITFFDKDSPRAMHNLANRCACPPDNASP